MNKYNQYTYISDLSDETHESLINALKELEPIFNKYDRKIQLMVGIAIVSMLLGDAKKEIRKDLMKEVFTSIYLSIEKLEELEKETK